MELRPRLALGLLLMVGCSSGGWNAMTVPPTVVRGVRVEMPQRSAASDAGWAEARPAGFVERHLRKHGMVLGSDGSARALYTYLSDRRGRVSPTEARPGDVLFFDMGNGCGGHVGILESMDREGRMVFREWRDGASRLSYASATQPDARRGGDGRVINTFLRPRRVDDLPGAHYLAGEMLCAVFTVDGRGGSTR